MSISRLKLFKRSNGKWYILFDEDGRTRWKSTGSSIKRDALKILTEFKELSRQKSPAIGFSQFVSEFNRVQAYSLRESTLKRIYRPSFEAFIGICGNKGLSAYTLRDVETFKRTMLERCSPTYVNIQLRALRAAFNAAVRWQLLQNNPFLKVSKVSVPDRVPAHFSKEQFKVFLGHLEEPVLRDLFAFASLTGLRQGELLQLRWANVDMQRKTVTVESSGRFLTKTGKARTIPASRAATEILERRYLVVNGTGLVFHRRGRELTQSYVEHSFKRVIRKLGFDERLRFHSLRHTFATWLVKEGVSLYEVQKLLGHSSIAVTQVYSHLAASELHGAVNKLNFN